MSRWLEETGGTRGESYDAAFEALAASGADVHGEAAFVAALVPPGASVLDAGCGTGRVAAELARRGHEVVGVDSDASMLDVARSKHPQLDWRLEDLAELDLGRAFDLVVAAGNVVVFLAPGTGPAVLRRMAAHTAPGGLVVSGWDVSRLSPEEYDGWAAAAGLEQVRRLATWDGDPWQDGADWCVAVHSRPAVSPPVDVGAG